MSTEITQIDNSPSRLLELAISKDADVEKLERLMDMQIKWEKSQAQKMFFEALSNFQSICPVITKNKAGHNYMYAPMSDIIAQIKGPLKECGLSYSFKQDHQNAIEVTCHVTHVNGHSESSSMVACADISGSKNAVQALGSTVTYLQRYTLLNVLGIATADADMDGRLPNDVDYKERAEKYEAAFNKLVAHNAVVREFYEEIYIIKEKLANNDVLGAKTDLNECMSSEQKDLLFRAEKHGAILSSKERTAMKNYSTEERNVA